MKWIAGQVLLGTGALVLLATSSNAQVSEVKWSRVSDQHQSSVEVPISVLKAKADPLGLGMALEGEGGAVQVYFQTETEPRHGFPGNGPKGDMDLKRSDCTDWPPAYYVLKPRLASYSCVKGDKINYYIARYNRSGYASLWAEYPQSERAFWDKAVGRMAASMKQMDRTEVR